MAVENGYTYTPDSPSAGLATITDFDPTTSSHGYDPVIPASFSGGTYTVDTIATSAFASKSLTSVTFNYDITLNGQSFESNSGMTVTIDADISCSNPTFGVFRYCALGSGLTINSNCTSLGSGLFKYAGLTSVTIPNNVTTLESACFQLNSISSLTLGSGVTTIPTFCFQDNSFASLTIPNTVTTLSNSCFRDNSISSLTLGSGVTTIGDNVFYDNSLSSLTIPSNVVNIGNYAFKNNSISSLTLNHSITWGYLTFENNGTMTVAMNEDQTTSTLSFGLFEGCTLGSNLSIGASVTTIPAGMFQDCGLTSITIPATVTSIESFAFRDNSITSLTLNNAVDLDEGCFMSNSGLSLTIGANLTTSSMSSADDGCFDGCAIAGNLTISEGVTSLPNYILRDSGITGALTLPSTLTSVGGYCFIDNSGITGALSLPAGLTSIGNRTFANCSISSIEFDHVLDLDDYSFYGNTGISITLNADITTNAVSSYVYPPFSNCAIGENLTIEEGVTRIDDYLFKDSGISGTLTLPSTLTTIRQYAFFDCSIGSIEFDHVLDLDDYAFHGNTGISITLNADITTNAVSSYVYPPFKNCAIAGNLTIGEGVTTIDDYLLKEAGLTSVNFPSTLTTINSYAFSQNSLTLVNLPESVTSIGGESFSYNETLASFYVLNDSMTFGSNCLLDNMDAGSPGIIYGNTGSNAETYAGTIANYDFDTIPEAGSWAYIPDWPSVGDCTLLYYIPDGNFDPIVPETVGGYDAVAMSSRACAGLSLTSVTINYPIQIGANAFLNNSGMTVSLNADVTTSVEMDADSAPFEGCTLGEGLTIGSSTTDIPDYLFANAGLTLVECPETLDAIGEQSFASNTALADFYVENDSMTFGTDCLLGNMSDISPGTIYGNSPSNAETYAGTISNYDFGSLVVRPDNFSWTTPKVSLSQFALTYTEWNAFTTKINEFRIYCEELEYSFTTVATDDSFTATIFNEAISALGDISAYFTGGKTIPTSKSQGNPIYASYLNDMVNAMNSIA